jgi:hypothetical protein
MQRLHAARLYLQWCSHVTNRPRPVTQPGFIAGDFGGRFRNFDTEVRLNAGEIRLRDLWIEPDVF